ncbi:S8 family serine peptidase [Actinobacillus vicugnae]|uniref:S8 family serine peptidase n=1 Tax=Actinobacillus vicugnae TaxID=2573093 RepID=UPI00124077BD|nr:S8 family serine peptidase [Actinobacillus vicugnae]
MFKQDFSKTLIALAICSAVSAQENTIINPHSTIGLSEALITKYSGKNVVVGVLDNGYFFKHALVNKDLLKPISFTLTNLKGEEETFDPTAYVTEIEEQENGNSKRVYTGHGAQVTGTIGAKKLQALGYQGGIAPQATLFVATAEATKTTGEGQEDEGENDKSTELVIGQSEKVKYARLPIATALLKLAGKKPLAINNSWNDDSTFDTAAEVDKKYKEELTTKENSLVEAIKQIITNQGTLMVFAAGNEGKKQPGIMAALPRYFPELESHYLSVAAVDTAKKWESYSNYCGVSKNWCITAPGTFSLLGTIGADKDKRIDTLEQQSGTSYATPVVTASLALLKERFPDLTASQIRDVLLTTAEDLGEKGVDEQYGWGLVDLKSAVKGPKQLLKDETFNITQQDTWENDLTSSHHFTKVGKATLTLTGENYLSDLTINDGQVALTGKNSVEHLINNAELSASDLTIKQSYTSSANSRLDVLANNAITATDKATVQLAGSLTVENNLLKTAEKGDRIGVLALQDNATYQGGFSTLTKNKYLTQKGLRQDLYFTPKGIDVKINANQTISDPNANANGKAGLKVLNRLRDSALALQAGVYNTWLQNALEKNQLQDFHYAVSNSIYADSLALLRSQGSAQLNRAHLKLSDNQTLTEKETTLWLDNSGQKVKSAHSNYADKLSGEGSQIALGAAHKIANGVVMYGEISHSKDKLTKPFASATIKQAQFTLGSRYQLPNWFVDLASNVGKISYKQHRSFSGTTLGEVKTTGSTLGLEARVGSLFQFNGWTFEPSVSLQGVRLSMKSANESGLLATSTDSYRITDLNAASGVKVQKILTAKDWTITPTFAVNYTHRLNHHNGTQITSRIADTTLVSKAVNDYTNRLDSQLAVAFTKQNWLIKTDIIQSWFKQGKATSVNVKLGFNF